MRSGHEQPEDSLRDLPAETSLLHGASRSLEQAIKAAEASMKAMKLSTDPAERAALELHAKQALEDAERIKERQMGRGGNTASSSTSKNVAKVKKSIALVEPKSSRVLPNSERILLLKASYLNNHKFPPWSSPPAESEFDLSADGAPFTDDAIFSLSPFQQKVLAGWERPAIALRPASRSSDDPPLTPTMTASRKIDLVQDASTDCSVVASLCAGIARAQRGHRKLMGSVLYPYDAKEQSPVISSNGKYIARLNFNGCYRRVVIDDNLPTSTTRRVIHMIDRNNPNLLWPILLEKAYLKVRGGYDFPGSNSATDLWILTGWIPEQAFLQADDLDLDRLWKRMFDAFGYGDVLITMGTGKMSGKVEREIGLAGEHDYAVLELREVDGQRLVLIKNPWCEGTSWYGITSAGNSTSANQPQHTNDEMQDDHVKSPRDLLNSHDQLSPGTFWMDLDNVAQYFESIYLNWNTGLFTNRQDIHFAWDLAAASAAGSRGRHGTLSNHPQFALNATKGGTTWLLLSRHFRNAVLGERDDRYDIDLAGFIALYAFAAGGKTIKLAEKVFQKSNFVDSPQILLKLDDCEPGLPYTIVPVEQQLSAAAHTFTISAFSNSPLTLGYASPSYSHSLVRKGVWTNDTAGGSTHSATYALNPQFSIVVPQSTRMSVLLEADKDELNVHVKLVHGKGQRVRAIRNRDIIFDSSDYRHRCCVAASPSMVEAGTYTIICSTFEPRQLGSFNLVVDSNEPVHVSALPREGAGRLRIELRATFAANSTQIAAQLTPRRFVNLYAVAQAPSTPHNITQPLNVTIEQGQGSHRRIIAASDDEDHGSHTPGPARTPDVDLSPDMRKRGDLWIVLARRCMAEQAEESQVKIDLLVDQPDAISCGDWIVLDE